MLQPSTARSPVRRTRVAAGIKVITAKQVYLDCLEVKDGEQIDRIIGHQNAFDFASRILGRETDGLNEHPFAQRICDHAYAKNIQHYVAIAPRTRSAFDQERRTAWYPTGIVLFLV